MPLIYFQCFQAHLRKRTLQKGTSFLYHVKTYGLGFTIYTYVSIVTSLIEVLVCAMDVLDVFQILHASLQGAWKIYCQIIQFTTRFYVDIHVAVVADISGLAMNTLICNEFVHMYIRMCLYKSVHITMCTAFYAGLCVRGVVLSSNFLYRYQRKDNSLFQTQRQYFK